MKTKIIVTVRGGNVESILSNDSKVEVVMLDHDNFEAGDEPTEEEKRYIDIVDDPYKDKNVKELFHPIY